MPSPFPISRRPLLAWLAAGAATAAFPSMAAQHRKQQAIALTGPALMERVNTDTGMPALAQGAKGDAVLRAQALLNQAWFSPGEIDGAFGANMRRMVAAFQASRRLLSTGRMEIKNAAKNPVFTFNPALLKNSKNTDVKSDMAAGPNNPVGVYWLGLSKPHWDIHGTPEPARVGSSESNGCIHLTNWDVLRLAQAVKVGFAVDVHA